ncbi:MAG TPA: DUF5677 domain-containing protein [Solirubrobacteraceae bacterium]|nr:DUF5677 domain-containing protein [Solirubrobacteraceae bacterium]
MDEHGFLANRAELRKRLRRHFEACDTILTRIGGEASAWRGRGRNDTSDRIVVAIWSRSLKTFMAVVHLCEGGFGEQAAMLNRSLFEDLADLAWTRTHPDVAVRNFDEHERFDMLHTLDIARKHPQFGEIPALSEEGTAELTRLRKRFDPQRGGGWTRLSLYQRLKQSEHAWPDEPDRLSVWAWYEIAHYRHNTYLHTTPWALSQTFKGVQDDTTAIFRAGPSDEMVGASLYAGAWTITAASNLVLNHFHAPDVEEFALACIRDINTMRPMSPEQLAHVGRNDLCPCESGRKFKRCHGDPID